MAVGSASRRPSMPTALSASCTRSPISDGATLRFSGPNATSAATVVVTIWSSGFWNTTPIERRALRYAPASAPCASSNTVWPISLTVPWSGAANPAIRRASVDLPAPLGPTSAMRSPGPTRKSTPSSTQVAPPS